MSTLRLQQQAGITLLESIIVLVLITIVSTFGYTSLLNLRQKQSLNQTVTQLQTSLDTVRTRSTATAPDTSGAPTQWGLLLDVDSNTYTTGPFDPDNFTANPPGAQITKLPSTLKLELQPPFQNPNLQLLITFTKLDGNTVLYRKTGNNLHEVNVSTWQPTLKIAVISDQWRRAVLTNSLGTTTLEKIEPL